MIDKDDWTMQKAEEIALKQTGYEFNELGPHIQMMCFISAEQEYNDMIADKADAILDRIREEKLGY